MYISRKKSTEETPCEETAIWSCTNDGCNLWIRDDYSFEDIPSCSQCNVPMLRGTKMLPVLLDSGYGLKKG